MKDLLTLLPYLRPYKKLLLASTLCIFASVLVGLLAPVILGYAVDGIQARLSWGNLSFYTLVILALTCVSSIFSLMSRYLTNLLSWRVISDFRCRFYTYLQKQSLYFFQRVPTSELMVRSTSEIEALHQLIGPVLMYVLQVVFTLALLLPLMLRISQRLTLLLFTTVPLAFACIYWFNGNTIKRTKKMQGCLLELLQRAQENLNGVRVVRAYSQEETEVAAFDELTRKHKTLIAEVTRLTAANAPLLQLLIGVSYVINFWYGSSLAISGGITLGQFIEFNAYLMRLTWPLSAFGQTIKQYYQGRLNLRNINELQAEEPVIKDEACVREQPPIRGRIEFRRLTLRYSEESEPVLSDIDLVVEAGQTVSFVGRTGSGKTTLVNLVGRLLEAPPGAVLIDGVPVSRYPLAQLRAAVGYVPQETLLFNGTLAENIAFGVEHAGEDELTRVAHIAGLSDDIRDFPAGFGTAVGERGALLSGGQKQRAALARALVRGPKVLILDDALSAVDVFTAEQILKRLRDVMSGRTCLVISNRISTVRDADLICVLEGGRIVERGTHEELLALGGEYASMYEREVLESELVGA